MSISRLACVRGAGWPCTLDFVTGHQVLSNLAQAKDIVNVASPVVPEQAICFWYYWCQNACCYSSDAPHVCGNFDLRLGIDFLPIRSFLSSLPICNGNQLLAFYSVSM
jgi:hypothetical protein